MTRMAECACGAFKVRVEGEPIAVGVCSCIQCQRRTGSVIGMGAYFPKQSVEPVADFKTFVRAGHSGANLTICFCPACGSSIFWEGGYSNPDYRGVAVGCFADPSFPAPQAAFFTASQHPWVTLPADVVLFETEPTQAEAFAMMNQAPAS